MSAKRKIRSEDEEVAEDETESLGSLASKMEKRISESQSALKRQEQDLETRKQAFADEQAAMLFVAPKDSDVIELNVGGACFSTLRGTLTQVSDSALSGMFSGRWDKGFSTDRDGRIFLDLDPDCFKIVLHQLRTMQMTGEVVEWFALPPPEGKSKYFVAMLKFLGLIATCEHHHKFHHIAEGVHIYSALNKAMAQSGGHRWAIGDTVMPNGRHTWGIQLGDLMKRPREKTPYIFIGIIATTNPDFVSQSDGTSFGWSDSVWIGGVSGARGNWQGFSSKDKVHLLLDADAGTLKMKVERLPGQVFLLDGLPSLPWRVHVQFFCANDSAELFLPSML